MKNIQSVLSFALVLLLVSCSSPVTPVTQITSLSQPTVTFTIPTSTEISNPPTATLTATIQANNCPSGDSLFALACQHNLPIGSAVRNSALTDENDPEYRQILASQFNMATPEYYMKFAPIHPEPDIYDFEQSDIFVDYAEQNNMLIRGHTLIWIVEDPDWINNGDWTRKQLIEVMHDHIATVVGRYKNRIYSWDVLNEGIDDETLELRQSKWMEVIGAEYVDLAFQFTHEADPDALLFYNDYDGEGLGDKSDAIYNLLKDLRSRNIPVHGVGLQMHVTLDDYPSQADLRANIRRLADLGLIVHITEMDVAIPKPVTPEKLEQQAAIYRDVLEVCLSEPACEAFLVWGFTDKHSWINDPDFHDKSHEAACLYDALYQPKPAYFSLQQVLAQP